MNPLWPHMATMLRAEHTVMEQHAAFVTTVDSVCEETRETVLPRTIRASIKRATFEPSLWPVEDYL